MTKRLIFIYQACIEVEYHSKSFRETKTIVLKKIKKSDYIFLKVYRSIALLNTMNKMLRLANMTHLYVVPTTNLFHLEGPFGETEPRGLGINLPRSCASGHEFRTISNICQLKRLYRPAVTIYLSSYALCYQPFALIESFDEMSAVSTSIDRLNETTRAKEST